MTTPIKPDFENLSAVAHDETPILTELRFPSPQRGRGARGEGDRELVGICYPCDIRPICLENPIQRGRGAQHRGGTEFSSNVEPQGRMKTSLTFKAKVTRPCDAPSPPAPLPRWGEGSRRFSSSADQVATGGCVDEDSKVRGNDLGGLFGHSSLRDQARQLWLKRRKRTSQPSNRDQRSHNQLRSEWHMFKRSLRSNMPTLTPLDKRSESFRSRCETTGIFE